MDRGEGRPLVIAHRAVVPGVPENSRAGVRASAAAGADLIEIDVRGSLENAPMVIHDPLLMRTTTGRGPVRLLPAFLLRRVRLRGNREPLPTLDDILDELPDGLGIGLHVKESLVIKPILTALDRHGVRDRAWWWLQPPRAVRLAQHLAPEMPIVLINSVFRPREPQPYLDWAASLGVTAVSPDWRQVTPELLTEAHKRDLLVFSVNHDPALLPAAVEAAIDGIITANPGRAREIVDRLTGAAHASTGEADAGDGGQHSSSGQAD